jgi:hypothetical protein
MNLQAILQELHANRRQIDEAILALERLATGERSKRRGRPPKWMPRDAPAATVQKRKGRTFTAAQRKAAADRMRKVWAAKKKAKG